MKSQDQDLTNRQRLAQTHPGFTLIELLVVISIIALLIGILLPVLGATRTTARSMVCNANQRQILVAVSVYGADHNAYLPGPNTSGYSDRRSEGRPDAPISADDWYSPILGSSLGLPQGWEDRALAIFNEEFRCPMNELEYDYVYRGPRLQPGTLLNSYGSPMGLHHYQDNNHRLARGQPLGATMGSPTFDARMIDVTTARHSFQTDSVGRASGKVFTYDGVRYVTRNGNGCQVSWSGQYRSNYGTNFITRSPTLNANFSGNGNPHYFLNKNRPNELALVSKVNGYRHNGDTIGLGFLDGHVESADSEASRNVNYYFPSGTMIRQTSGIGDRNAQVGDVVD